ncbi:MAG: type II secretion system protein GspJ [Planctomycetota bacterium]|jgi:general secretion pathway protein J
MRSRKSGFTLVEALLTSVIGAFIALVAVGTLKTISSSARAVDNNANTAAEVRFASSVIAADLMNLYRDEDMEKMRLVGGVAGSGENMSGYLILYTIGRVKARSDQPEGEVYEVEYCLKREKDTSVLLRRLWPNPDRDAEPGGTLTVIAENIDLFAVRFFDGREWQVEWTEEMKSIPDLVEITMAATEPDTERPLVQNLVVNFARSPRQQEPEGGAGEQSTGRREGRR